MLGSLDALVRVISRYTQITGEAGLTRVALAMIVIKVAKQQSVFHKSPGKAASGPESRASKYILMNIRLSRLPVAMSTSV